MWLISGQVFAGKFENKHNYSLLGTYKAKVEKGKLVTMKAHVIIIFLHWLIGLRHHVGKPVNSVVNCEHNLGKSKINSYFTALLKKYLHFQ